MKRAPPPEPNPIAGYLMGQAVTVEETRQNPDILKDFRFLSIHRANNLATMPVPTSTEDWKCDYCGYLRPSTEYKCGNCGGPKTTKTVTKTNEVMQEFQKQYFKKWGETVLGEAKKAGVLE